MHTFFVLALSLLGSTLVGADAADVPVTFLPATRVDAAFEKGMPLLESSRYKIHASRRDVPGKAEVHVLDTDILYVLEGGAILVTGGALVGGASVAPDEIRGAAIRGGATRSIGKGDVLVVPSGTPHQFLEVRAPLLYYVVKVAAPRDGR